MFILFIWKYYTIRKIAFTYNKNPYVIQNYLRITYGQKSVCDNGAGNLHTNIIYGILHTDFSVGIYGFKSICKYKIFF